MDPLIVCTTGRPKKMVILSGFEFLTLGGVFLGVKNNSKNSENKKILSCLAKFWVKWPCFFQNYPIFLNFHDFVSSQSSKTFWKVKIFNIHVCICINFDFYDILKSFPFLTWPSTLKNTKIFCIFLINKVHLLKILLNNHIFFGLRVLRIIFYP